MNLEMSSAVAAKKQSESINAKLTLVIKSGKYKMGKYHPSSSG